MSDEYMLCNFKNCNKPLTRTAWITRCSHVFCDLHGVKYFTNSEPKVKCPACFEMRNRETDIYKADLNPPDMLICCVRPDKALEYAARACKLWSYQMQIKRKLNMGNVSSTYEKMKSEAVMKFQVENNELKSLLRNVEEMSKLINEELMSTKLRLKKYKNAYESLLNSKYKSDIKQKGFIPKFEEFNRRKQQANNFSFLANNSSARDQDVHGLKFQSSF